MDDLTIELLRNHANTKEQNETKNLLTKLKYKRRFGGNKGSLAQKLAATNLAETLLTQLETEGQQHVNSFKQLTTTTFDGQTVEIKPVNPEILPAQYKSVRVKVAKGTKGTEKGDVQRKVVTKKKSSNLNVQWGAAFDMNKLKAMIPDINTLKSVKQPE